MKLMRKGDVTRYVTDKEAQYLVSNGYAEVEEEKTNDKKVVKKAEKKPAALPQSPSGDSSLGEGAK